MENNKKNRKKKILEDAVQEVKNGSSVFSVSLDFGVPISILNEKSF
jgi:hypothetical protein